VREGLATEEVSLGDFVLTGGEVAALAVAEAAVRLVPGALGDAASAEADSFAEGLLDFPHYTPLGRAAARSRRCCSGNHAAVRRYRRKEALRATRARRPDLLESASLAPEDEALLCEIRDEEASAAPGAHGEAPASQVSRESLVSR
jgi:tRNA (guanine37-N1)-methyltransferase